MVGIYKSINKINYTFNIVIMMAKLSNNAGDKKEVQLNESLIKAAEELGVPFSCQQGVCGTCRVEITEGADLLNELTEAEKSLGDRDQNNRLCCQMKIVKEGTVKFQH